MFCSGDATNLKLQQEANVAQSMTYKSVRIPWFSALSDPLLILSRDDPTLFHEYLSSITHGTVLVSLNPHSVRPTPIHLLNDHRQNAALFSYFWC